MNIALFGGTFDPIHCGHLSAARAARHHFALDQIHFIPAGRPPHRQGDEVTAFEHRYAMVALACAGEPAFVPSLAEAPSRRGPSYSITTVRKFRRQLGAADRLFFIVGVDAFLEIKTWRQWRSLLTGANFLIVSRPGFPLRRVAQVFPADLLLERRAVAAGSGRVNRPLPGGVNPPLRRQGTLQPIEEFHLRGSTASVLSGVWVPVSATEVRRRARHRKDLAELVPEPVAEYIAKQHLYG